MAVGDIKLAYGASAALTITLASLASDTTRLTGRESTAVSNLVNKYTDVLIGGFVTAAATTTTADKRIEVWAYGAINQSPSYPAGFTGVDSGRTIPSANVKRSAVRLLATMTTDTTANRTYFFGPVGLAELFGGVMPTHWGVFVTHDMGVALNATGGTHSITYTPIYSTVE